MTPAHSPPSPWTASSGLELAIPAEQLEELNASGAEAAFSHPGARWRSQLNCLTLQVVQQWLRVECPGQVQLWPGDSRGSLLRNRALASQWELVNGSAIVLNGKRLILIPDAAIDQRELLVPQEWVDIPTWAGDYYLAVQVNLDEGWLRLWGYASHRQLKQQGQLDWDERAYSLDEDQVLTNLDALWLSQSLSFSQPLRAPLTELATLPTAQAQQLIDRLGQPSVTFPRQAIPFDQWASLISHGGWRQRLFERRQGLPEQRSILQWLQAGISELGEQVGWQSQGGSPAVSSRPAIAMRSDRPDSPANPPASPPAGFSRSLTIAGQAVTLSLFPRPGDTAPVPDDVARTWRFELRPAQAGETLAEGTTLTLLTEDLQAFPHNEDRAEIACDRLYVDVILEPGEGLVWETDPSPEDYEREILQF